MTGSGNLRASVDVAAKPDELALAPRYWAALALLTAITVFDYFDLSVIGFLGATIAQQDHLKYGQLGAVLLATGVGGVVGALASGHWADRYGRRIAIVSGTCICGLSSLCVLLVPTGAWLTLAVLRFFVGVGIAAAAGPTLTLAVEYTPPRHRHVLSSLPVIGATAGALVATATIAGLVATLGWRSVAALGAAPMFLGWMLWIVCPESPAWLSATGRPDEAHKARALLHGLPMSATLPPQVRGVEVIDNTPFSAVFRDRRRAALTIALWGGALTATSGVYLWGPTLVALALNASAASVARIFMAVAVAGIVGKIAFSILPRWLGRRRTNVLGCFGSAAMLAAVGPFHELTLGAIPVLTLLLICGALFFDGLIANLAPYTVEIYPTELAARGYGLGQAASGVGRIAGPLVLALLAGTDTYVSPHATLSSFTSSFVFLAACSLVSALASLLIPIDPRI